MPMRNRVRRASLHAVSTKNTTVIMKIVDFGVAFGAAYAVFIRVVGGFDVDAVGGAIGGAEETGDAFFQAVFVALQNMRAAEAGFDAGAAERAFAVGIIFYRRGLEHLHEGDAHALGDGGDVFQDRHALLVYRKLRDRGAGSPGADCCSASGEVSPGPIDLAAPLAGGKRGGRRG